MEWNYIQSTFVLPFMCCTYKSYISLFSISSIRKKSSVNMIQYAINVNYWRPCFCLFSFKNSKIRNEKKWNIFIYTVLTIEEIMVIWKSCFDIHCLRNKCWELNCPECSKELTLAKKVFLYAIRFYVILKFNIKNFLSFIDIFGNLFYNHKMIFKT